MMDWTDRHCRFFHRQLTRCALLYTEMVVADAVIHGQRERLLGFDAVEHPVALQLGGSDPAKLADAARIGAEFGYDEINLNVGCPSDRVQSGTLDTLAADVFAAGADALWVHARKAWLEGLSPKENRDIPPLDYGRVYRLKEKYPDRFIGINGGIGSIAEASAHLQHVDGAMLGRAAYQTPGILAEADATIYGEPARAFDANALLEAMCAYAERHIAAGGRLGHVTRHMVGLFHGLPGARRYRQILSVDATKTGAGPDVLRRAFDAVEFGAEMEAA
jgi:tRNA-dihydrouridine synthase A